MRTKEERQEKRLGKSKREKRIKLKKEFNQKQIKIQKRYKEKAVPFTFSNNTWKISFIRSIAPKHFSCRRSTSTIQ